MNDLINTQIKTLREIFKEHLIKEAYVFGSVTTDQFNEDSDVDILVSFINIPFDGYADNLWDLEDKLEDILGRKVDVIPDHTLKNPYFINSVDENKIKIYG